jgi:hypothetical protein
LGCFCVWYSVSVFMLDEWWIIYIYFLFLRLLSGFFRVSLGVGLGFLWVDLVLFSGWSSSFYLLSSQFPNNYAVSIFRIWVSEYNSHFPNTTRRFPNTTPTCRTSYWWKWPLNMAWKDFFGSSCGRKWVQNLEP